MTATMATGKPNTASRLTMTIGRTKLIGRGRCCRNRGRNGCRGRCRERGRRRSRERGRRSRRFWRGARCLCVDGQRQAKSSGATKNICFHSFHLSMRCREKPVRIQNNDLVSSKFEGYAPSCLKIGARLKRQRVTRLELATSSLARRCSTTELHPHKSGSNNRSRPHQRKIFCRNSRRNETE